MYFSFHFFLECPQMSEATVLGAAMAAGRAVGVWIQPSLLPAPRTATFTPLIGHDGERHLVVRSCANLRCNAGRLLPY